MGLAFGQKFSEEENVTVRLCVCGCVCICVCVWLGEWVLHCCLSHVQPDPFKLKTGGLVNLKEIQAVEAEK